MKTPKQHEFRNEARRPYQPDLQEVAFFSEQRSERAIELEQAARADEALEFTIEMWAERSMFKIANAGGSK